MNQYLAGYQNLWHLLQFEETEMLELFPFNRQMERVEFRYFLNKIRSSVSISVKENGNLTKKLLEILHIF